MGCSGVRYDDEQQTWADAMARWEGLVDAAADRARRRDLFAAAALTGLLADSTLRASPEKFAHDAVWTADALLAALDATAGPARASVPPAIPVVGSPPWAITPPMAHWNEAAMRYESCSLRVTTSTGTKLMGMCVQYTGCDPVWLSPDDRRTVIHDVIGWEPIDVPPAPQSLPAETQAMQRGGA